MGLNNEDIKQLISILQKALVEDNTEDEDEEVEEPAPVVKKRPRTRSKTNKTPKKRSINKFESMPEFSMCKEDLEFDRKVKKPPPSARLRDFEPIKVQCRVCGKKEKVAPDLVDSIERYKCNKCATGAG
jgi:hypothetical protein